MRTVDVGAEDADGFLTGKDRRLHCGLAFDVVAANALVLHAHTHVPRVVAACLLELARQPALQQRVARELRRALDGVADGILDAPGPPPGLQQALHEALRLHPPCGVLLTEVGAEGLELPGAPGPPLSPGTRVYVAVRALHRDPELYKDPLRFDPSRFSPEARQSRAPGAFVPFGELPADADAPGGQLPQPAVSTGARFALQEMWTCLAALLADLQFDLGPRTTDMSEDDAPELWLRVRRRSREAALAASLAQYKVDSGHCGLVDVVQ
ncbi:hypothetical protein ONE63_009818 [Megalurothrips usitatus]|uniref:Cytochrome P450 n=1 Tax=Megalurothrips usitatus TaxID=439358 RepID=A0AAV7XK61_9NEOP|nr:hypothetical protein ONE63_009818 [Megalurothrips usitatus]